MKVIQLSFILPIYNVQNYLRECVESIISQWNDSCEIIMVDDGSSDNSGAICDSYRQDRITVIHKKNGGLSSARNVGMKYASGKYIAFVDADDKIAPNTITHILKWIYQGGSDYCFMQGIKFYSDGRVEELGDDIHSSEVNNQADYIKYLSTKKKYPGSACTKIYKKDFLVNNQIRFPLDRRLSEDLGFTLECIMKASSFDILDCPFYEYRQNREGSITTAVSQKTLDGLCLFIKESIDKLTRNKKPKDEKCKCLMNFVSYEYYILLYNYSLYQGEDKHLYLNELQNYKWVTKYTASMKFKVLMFFLRILGIEITSKIVGIIKNKRK